jgi:hypothetical protein
MNTDPTYSYVPIEYTHGTPMTRQQDIFNLTEQVNFTKKNIASSEGVYIHIYIHIYNLALIKTLRLARRPQCLLAVTIATLDILNPIKK